MTVVLVADPPWPLKDKLPGPGRGAVKHYKCMTVADICNYPLPHSVLEAPSAILFLWRLASMPEEAYQVARAWGFVPKSELVWQKLTKNGKHHFGMGSYTRASHETCIIAVKGKPSLARPAIRNQRSTFEAPVGRHSAKPDEFYQIVERMYPDSVPYELFARVARIGWCQEGDELIKECI